MLNFVRVALLLFFFFTMVNSVNSDAQHAVSFKLHRQWYVQENESTAFVSRAVYKVSVMGQMHDNLYMCMSAASDGVCHTQGLVSASLWFIQVLIMHPLSLSSILMNYLCIFMWCNEMGLITRHFQFRKSRHPAASIFHLSGQTSPVTETEILLMTGGISLVLLSQQIVTISTSPDPRMAHMDQRDLRDVVDFTQNVNKQTILIVRHFINPAWLILTP